MIDTNVCCPLAACAKSQSCARFANFVKARAEREYYPVLNDAFLHPSEEGCPHYIVPKKITVAYGFKRLYSTIPVGRAKYISWGVYFGSDSTYYRTKRGDRPLYPKQQKQILAAVKTHGGNPNVGFDRYLEEVIYVKP